MYFARLKNADKKEIYINKLVRIYNEVYDCDDITSINTLRKNYTKDELKLILAKYKESEKLSAEDGGNYTPGVSNLGFRRNFFKEVLK